MQLQIKLQKTKEITYFNANKQQTRYHLTYLKKEKKERKKVPLIF